MASDVKLSAAQKRILKKAVEDSFPDGTPISGRSVAAVQCLKRAGLIRALIARDEERLHIRVWATDAGRARTQEG